MNHRAAAPFLELSQVTVIKSGKAVLKDISLSIRDDENVAILGPNGAGKSSLIRLITREYYPVDDPRTVCRIWGRDDWHVFSLRADFGILSDDLQYLFTSGYTGRDVILSGFFSSIGLFHHELTPEMERKAAEIGSFLEVTDLMERQMNQISSGEARRFLIGRALVHHPRVLILDEPTRNLDLHALHSFRAMIRKVAGAGTRIIMVTHNLHDIIPEITRVIMIRDGAVYQDGKKEDLLTPEHMEELFSVPVKIHREGGYYYTTGY